MINHYTKYPVRVDQLGDEILSSMGLILVKLEEGDLFDGDIAYTDDNIDDNLHITTTVDLTQQQQTTLDMIVNNHVANSTYKQIDWARRRDALSPLFYAEAGAQLQNFAGMSIHKKLIGCVFFFIPYNVRTQIISDAQDSKNWEFLLKKTKESRSSCIEAMRICTGEYMRVGQLTLPQTQTFYKDVFEYINWFTDANAPDFKQWLTNETGSPYETAGFSQTTYYMAQLKTDLMAIYNGNY